MKTIAKSSFILALVLAFLAPGCKKSEPAAPDTALKLDQAFETAETALKDSVTAVTASLRAKNFAEATKALEPIVSNPKLTEPQKAAIMSVILQINEAVANDPKLDSSELSDLRRRMFMSLRGGR
jgi:hypothetical protein